MKLRRDEYAITIEKLAKILNLTENQVREAERRALAKIRNTIIREGWYDGQTDDTGGEGRMETAARGHSGVA